jgi:hypothetical protein
MKQERYLPGNKSVNAKFMSCLMQRERNRSICCTAHRVARRTVWVQPGAVHTGRASQTLLRVFYELVVNWSYY